MKFVYTLLAVPAVALAAPNMMPALFRREGAADAAQQIIAGAAKAMTCFEIALDKAGGNPAGASVPMPPMGVNCAAILSLVQQGMTSGSVPTPTSSATSSMTSPTMMNSSMSMGSTAPELHNADAAPIPLASPSQHKRWEPPSFIIISPSHSTPSWSLKEYHSSADATAASPDTCSSSRFPRRTPPPTRLRPTSSASRAATAPPATRWASSKLKPADAVADFALLRPLDPYAALGDYLTNDKEIHFLFCHTCGVRYFSTNATGEVVRVDVAALGLDAPTEAWRAVRGSGAPAYGTFVSVNGHTIDVGQGFDMRELTEKKCVRYLDTFSEVGKELDCRWDRPHDHGCY